METKELLKDIVKKLDTLVSVREQENSGLWDLRTTARALGMTESLLKEMAQKRKIPCYRPATRSYVFSKNEVLAWLKTKRTESADDLGKSAILEKYMNS